MRHINLPCSVIITKSHGGDKPRMCVTVEDERSGCQVVRVELSMEEFAQALTATNGYGEMRVNVAGTVGKYPDHKEVPVPSGRYYMMADDARKAAIDAALAPFEVDGWVGDRDDMTNGHRSCDHKGSKCRGGPDGFTYQLVHFRRYLDDPPAGYKERTRD